MGAYRIPSETGLLIPSEKTSYRKLATSQAIKQFVPRQEQCIIDEVAWFVRLEK
jgi:hypothetical protein